MHREGERMESSEGETLLKGQVEIWQLTFGFAESMALKCAVELGIADIIISLGVPVTLSQITSGIDSPFVDIPYLARIMRFLVRKQVFSEHNSSDGGDPLHGLTDNSKWLLLDSEVSLASMVLMENNPWQLAPWHHLSQCVKEGGIAFKKAHGCEMWNFASQNPEFNRVFNDALACTAKIILRAVLSYYKDGFDGVETLLDVGGGTGGNLVQWVLHDWGDEYCVQILKNCRKAIPEKTGKLILVEIVLQPEKNGRFGDMGMLFDLLMFAHTTGENERTELEWKKLLEEGGYPRYKIINIPAVPSIIEAYPQ